MPRFIRSRFIPEGSIKVADKQSDAVAYVYATGANKNRLAAVIYHGKQSKPVAHHGYRTEAERENNVRSYFDARRKQLAARAEYKAERLAPNKLVVGDILSTCWGYDQTNREFYEVTTIAGQHVTIREIASERTGDWSGDGKCVPRSGDFIGEAVRKLVQHGTQVSINGHITASKWNVATVAGVPVGPALHWSAGH